MDSRESKEGEVIRRRRECLACGKRFTSYERIDQIPHLVVKKDGRRERFDREKVLSGLIKACQKRPVPVKTLETIADKVEAMVQEITGVKVLSLHHDISTVTGEEVELRIKSDDTAHGFRIVGLETNVAIPKRGKGELTVRLRVEKPGRYEFHCNRMCGAGHNFMRGELVVREPAAAVSR